MRRGDLNHNSGRLLTALVLLFTLATGNAWGGGSYYTGFKATGGAIGKGYVYASTSSTATPEYDTEVVGQEKSDNTGSSSGTNTYYAWAKAVRGNKFKQWSADKASGSANTGEADAFTVTSNTKNGTTTGVVTAQWDTYTKVNVTYNASDDGEYTVAYSYNSYNSTEKTITAGDAEGLGCTINSDNGSKTIGSYYNDVITLTSTKGDFQGWYKASDTNNSSNLLSTDNPYTYVAPQSGTGSVYAKYPHVEKYYGRLTASIAAVPYSMPAGGMIFITKEEAATPSYSENAQTVDNVGMGTTSLTYYLRAQPTDKRYVFRGWYSNAQCTGTPISTNKVYTYSFTASSTNSSSPTEGNVYAAFDFNLYYMEVQAQPATPGLGMVLVSDTKLTSPAYTEFSSESSQFAYAYRLTHTTDVYVYAKPKYGYKLSGWYSDAACTQAVTVDSDGKYTASSTASTDPMNPDTITLYAKFVPATDGDKISLTYKIPDKTKGEYTASVLDITEVDDEYVWTFTEVYNSVDYTADKAISQHKTDVLRLEAACKAGYGVTSWTDAGTAKTTPSHLYETTGTATGKTYGVAFGDAKPFLVSTNSTQYATLAEALTAVGNSGQITVVQNAYVPAGNYTIPSGVTLLVPCDAEYTCYKKLKNGYTYAAYASSWTKPTGAYCTLTLASGAHIVLNGDMSVSAKMNWAMGNNGSPSGLYGFLKMNGGSTLTLKSGSNLYAWGYIAGEGTITAESGSNTYEGFQVTGYRGGNATSGMAGNKYDVFPMNQYYIQNIENKITFQSGALEHLFMGVTSSWGNEGASIDFIGGPNSSNTLFLLKSGATLTKWYDPSKDRQKFELNGNAELDQIVLDVADVSSKDYVLPLTNNMDLDIVSGTTTINYDVAIFPDANIWIRQGAQITIKNGANVYIYDESEWNPAYAYAKYTNNDKNTQGAVTFSNVVRPIEYTTTTKYSRTSVTDANIMVEGVLKVASGGNLYTTASGANIIGGNGGNIILEGTAPSNGVTYQAVQSTTGSGNTIHHYDAITVNPAKLHNADDSYLATAGAQANDKFLYSQNMGQWLKNPKTVTWNANGGTTEATTMAYSQGQFLGELPAAYKEGHTLAGWFTAATNGTQISATYKVDANVTYYAHWTPIIYNITYKDQGKAEFSSTHIDEPNAHPTKHTYGTTTTLKGANNKTGYDFGGWHTISNCKESSMVTSLSGDAFAKDITLYAKWTPQVYAITYKDKGDAAFSGTSWASTQPTEHTYGTATTLVNPSKPNYTFGGWYTTQACTGSAVTSLGATAYTSGPITLYAKWNETPHTVSVAAGDNGSVSPTSVNGVGVATASGDITATPSTGYSFSSWTLPESGVTAASGYNTSSNPIRINATADGKTITANFAVVNYDVTYTVPSNGSYTIKVADAAAVSASTTAQYNQTVVLAATPEEGYKFDHWTVTKASSGTVTVTDNQFSMPAEAVTVSATFALDVYAVTIGVNNAEYGSVSPTSVSNVPYGSSVSVSGNTFTVNGTTVTATPADQTAQYTYAFDHWENWPATITGDVDNIQAVFTRTPHYTITWKVDGKADETTMVTEGTNPEYPHGEPTKASTDKNTFTFEGWSNGTTAYAKDATLPAVTGPATYTAQFQDHIRYYTITWKNWDGTVLETDEGEAGGMQYGAQVSYDGDTPTKTDSETERSYTFKGWSPEVVDVDGDATYTAQFDMALTISEGEPYVVSNLETATVTTVCVQGTLKVPDGSGLTTSNIIIEAASGSSGNIEGIENVVATNAYFDYQFDVDPWHWSAFGVPFEIDLDVAPLKDKTDAMVLGTDYDIVYYNTANRAAKGVGKKSWEYVENHEHKLIPGVLYMIAFNTPVGHVNTVRFTKKSGAAINYATDVPVVTTGTGTDDNWNGIANPKMYHALLDAGVEVCQVHDGGPINGDGYHTYTMHDGGDDYKFFVGKAAFVQTPSSQSFVEVDPATTESPIIQKAPRRANSAMNSDKYSVQIAPADGEMADRVIIRAEEDKEDEYVIVSDLAKMGVSPSRAQMWVDRYGVKLCKNTTALINNQASYPLSIFVPQTGEYVISSQNSAISSQTSDMLYLTYDGRVIWNLTYAPYTVSFEKGTNTHYGLTLVRSNTPTDIEQSAFSDQPSVQKIIIDNQVYILRGGEMYSITGQKAQ